MTVTELVARLKRAVEIEGAESNCVVGEIGSCKPAPSGHLYFTLKDENAQLQCVLYAFRARMMRTPLRVGMQVELYGHPTVWEGRGSLQFLVDRVREAGVGTLQQRFEALKARLLAEGLFDTARKKELPEYPQSVCLITSPTGAVIEDMRHRLGERAPWIQTYLYPVQVQGKGAEYGLARAVERMGHPEAHGLPRVDYLVLARGGGSMEDLWCFNEEVLARAIADCPLPVVSAVGHETDFTIADFVADLRAPTPTAAIELTTPDAAELLDRLAATEQHLRTRLQAALHMARLRLKVAEQSALRHPLTLLAPHQQRLDILTDEIIGTACDRLQRAKNALDAAELRLAPRTLRERLSAHAERLTHAEQRLRTAAAHRLSAANGRLDTQEARLSAADPQRAVQRGFALVRRADGSLARDAADLRPGDRLTLTLARGSVEASVTSISDDKKYEI